MYGSKEEEMSGAEKRKRKKDQAAKDEGVVSKSTQEWKDFFEEKFNRIRCNKATLLYTWYLGDSDLLTQAYIDTTMSFETNVTDVRNSKTYFWYLASKEANFKKTHSGLPKAVIKTLINILDIPEAKAMKDGVDERKLTPVDDELATSRLQDILKDNDMDSILKQQQEPMMWVMGDGAYIVSVDPSVSRYPIIEYVNAKNCAFEIKANRVVKIYTRSFYKEGTNSYCLLQERGTETKEKGLVLAYIKATLFKTAQGKKDVMTEVPLDSLSCLKGMQPVQYYKIDEMLAVPCLYDYEPLQGRGVSMFNEKMDLFDDLDQAISEGGNAVRASAPIEYIDESMVDVDLETNKKVLPATFGRKFLMTKQSNMAVGENNKGIDSSVPQIDFNKYSDTALALTSQILTGIISPCTIGADVSKKDNAEAQREKEKQTMFTRASLVTLQQSILSKLYNLVLKVDDYINHAPIKNYDVVINYAEYGSPTFDDKLQLLYPAYSSGTMSPERFVELLYGDTLTEQEKESEVEFLKQKAQEAQAPDPMGYE